MPWTNEEWRRRVRDFARSLGLAPEDDPLIFQALTHRSLTEEISGGDNERLEFLGDSVLALLVAEHVYREHPGYTEGQLTKLKISYVSEPSLAAAALALGLGDLIAMAPGDELGGGRARAGMLSDAFEAVLAALFLSRGLARAREFVERELIQQVDPTVVWDYKSRLQELCQETSRITPIYRTEVESGEAHERVFKSEVLAGDERLGEGTGRSKKLAEQAAAEDALSRIEPKKAGRRPRKAAAL